MKILLFINKHYSLDDEILFVLEAPMTNAKAANFLFEHGWLFNDIYSRLPSLIEQKCSIIEVPPSTLKKWGTGKGNRPKDHKADEKIPCMACYMRDEKGIVFERDLGKDKLHAYLLAKMGNAILDGEYKYEPPHRRGKGAKTTARMKAKKNASLTKADSKEQTQPKSPVSRGNGVGVNGKPKRSRKTSG